MQFFKRIWDKINRPHGIFLVLFYIFFALAVAGTLVLVILKPEQTILHYCLYAISALSLTYFVYTIVIFAPKMKDNTIAFLKKHKFTNALLEDFGYRTIIFSIISFIINIAYVGFMLVMAIWTKSAWYFSITAYYLVLTIMKGNVFYSKRKYNTQ